MGSSTTRGKVSAHWFARIIGGISNGTEIKSKKSQKSYEKNSGHHRYCHGAWLHSFGRRKSHGSAASECSAENAESAQRDRYGQGNRKIHPQRTNRLRSGIQQDGFEPEVGHRRGWHGGARFAPGHDPTGTRRHARE